jgi:hypothetical protein
LAFGATSFALLAFSLSQEFDFPVITIWLAVIGVCFVVGGYRYGKKVRAALYCSFSMLPSALGAWVSILSSNWTGSSAILDTVFYQTPGPWVKDAMAILAFAAGLGVISGFLRHLSSATRDDNQATISAAKAFGYTASIFLLILVWLVVHAVWAGGAGTAICLVIYSVVGIGAYLFGSIRERSGIQLYGTILTLGVAGRLLFIDVWTLDTPYRIAAFISVGAVLLLASRVRNFWKG